MVKPRIVYQHASSVPGSRIVANMRQRFNDGNIRALTPGLAFRKEIVNLVDGPLFDQRIPFTEDAVLDWKLRRAGVNLKFLPLAVVFHSPISLLHDIRAAYRMGYGHRLAVHFAGREKDNSARKALKRLLTGDFLKAFIREETKHGVGAALYDSVWSALYNMGYFSEQFRIKLIKE